MTPADRPPQVPGGRWIVCGYGRFGRTVRRHLCAAGATVTVVADREFVEPGEAEGIVIGSPLDAARLREAGIEEAEGVVVTTAEDTTTLAITMLARELRPGIFTVVRQNEKRNTPLFRALAPDIATLSGYIVAAEVLRIIRAPQLSYFLRLARHEGEDGSQALLARMRERIGNNIVDSWSLRIDEREAPALASALAGGSVVRSGI